VLNDDPGALPYYINRATEWLAELYRTIDKPDEAAKYTAMLIDQRK